MIAFLKEKRLVTIPDYIGPFLIRQLPEAFKPTSPGGFMNPPGIFDPDNSGFFFIPTYNPQSRNFYIRAAIEDPRPILGHEGIPGHFLQISIGNHLQNELAVITVIRSSPRDGCLHRGDAAAGRFYPPDSAGAAVASTARYRARALPCELHTGKGYRSGGELFLRRAAVSIGSSA
jgi:hypothetical protein